ncbi:MAG: Nramp family divalent metal transporter [Planctomycetaceae bacterium]
MNNDSVTTLPRTFYEYVRSFGPGLVVVLTWLGAGDIVEMGIAGGDFGYSLMWVLVLAIAMRFLFVSLIAKYQLCNQHGEGVLDGLARLHPWYAPLLLAAAFVLGHLYGAYMTRGVGEACANLTGIGQVWQWAVLSNVLALFLVFQPAYQRVEAVFKVLLALLSVSFAGTAIWVGPNPAGIARGLISLEIPEQSGQFGPWLIAVGMIGAVGGSLMNLVYPYFIEAKGWRGPKFRSLQFYDFLLAMIVMIILNLAIWTLGAELLHPKHATIREMDDLPRLLSEVLGRGGHALFYCGVLAAVFTSLVGHAIGLALLGSHAWLRWHAGSSKLAPDGHRQHPLYHVIVVWCLISPLIWTVPGMPGFVPLTLIVNAAQVMLLPVVAGGLWCITARSKYIGEEFRNRWWDNLVMFFLVALAVFGAFKSAQSVIRSVQEMV